MPPFYEKPPGKTRGLFLCALPAPPSALRPRLFSRFGRRSLFSPPRVADRFPCGRGVGSAKGTVKAVRLPRISGSTYDFAGPLSCA